MFRVATPIRCLRPQGVFSQLTNAYKRGVFRSFAYSSSAEQEAAVSTSSAALLDTAARKTTKHPLSRKTFLVDYYKHINDSHEILLFLHHNNLTKTENSKFRNELRAVDARFNVIRNSIYEVYLKSAHEKDPADEETALRNKNVKHPLAPLLKGPTGVVTILRSDPTVVQKILKIIKHYNEKLILIGAKVEAEVYDVAKVDQYKNLPTKENLQGELAGVLTILGGAGLVKTLEAPGQHMYLVMEARKDQLDPDSKKKEEDL